MLSYTRSPAPRGEKRLVSGLFRAATLDDVKAFAASDHGLGVVSRAMPDGAADFFNALTRTVHLPECKGLVRQASAKSDIRYYLEAAALPEEIKSHAFFEIWLDDMSKICRTFCDMLKQKTVHFWLGSKRGCRRYHVDNVPYRLLVTYTGKGTEWVPDHAADRRAFFTHKPNEEIVKDRKFVRHMDRWDVGIFRGGSKGIIHRTPDEALSGHSLLLRLDHPRVYPRALLPAVDGEAVACECVDACCSS